MSAKFNKEQHLEMNRLAWDDAHRFLAEKRKNKPNWGEEFKDGGGLFTETELQLLGDVSGADVLQLSCAGDASQAFSLANLGAKVTACDFSSVAIEDARGNAEKLGLDVTFVVDDSQRLSNFEENQFDLVHADYNLWYYEDLVGACHNWYRVLRPNGRLLLHEMNPLTNCLVEDETTGGLKCTRAYNDKVLEYYPFEIGSYASDMEAVEFQYTIADIVNAVLAPGFVIRKMVERVRADFIREKNDAEGSQEDVGESDLGKLPQDFFIVADKLK